MSNIRLWTAQMLENHPVKVEKDRYKIQYLNILEYFVRKYASDDIWAKKTFDLYVDNILVDKKKYQYSPNDFRKQAKAIRATKFKPFRMFTYRYCMLMDCIFLCAYTDKRKGEKIFNELSNMYYGKYEKKLKKVFQFLYNISLPLNDIRNGSKEIDYIRECWIENRRFCSKKPIKIMITANMSAGKSTLLNAFVGKKVNRTQNEACTAKIHYIINKAYEDGLTYKVDSGISLNAQCKELMEDDINSEKSAIVVSTFFRTFLSEIERIYFIDTPGVNSSQNAVHREIAEKAIVNERVDLLIYVLNGENIGTEDDRKHLRFIRQNYHGKILFVINKLDKFRSNEDSVIETLNSAVEDLKSLEFENPNVVPVSAYAAYLAQINLLEEALNEDEQDEIGRLKRKFRKTEFQLDTYYPENVQQEIQVGNDNDAYKILLHSGILHLEKMIYELGGKTRDERNLY